MSSYENIGDELPDAVPTQPAKTKRKSPYAEPIHFDNGVASLVMFLLFLFLGYLGFKQNLDVVSDLFTAFSNALNSQNYNSVTSMEPGSLVSGQLMMIGAVICYILSLSFAGASLATRQTSILGLFVLVLSLAPWIYSLGALLLELPSIPSFFM